MKSILKYIILPQMCIRDRVYYIFPGTALGVTEGPVLFKCNGWYYLITAEGGTEYNHAVTLARSRQITGPYEVHLPRVVNGRPARWVRYHLPSGVDTTEP